MTGSRQVCWFEVHQFVAKLVAGVAPRPPAGTPAWSSLADDDPRKLAAVLEAGIHWSLRIDTEQAARAEASQHISVATNWSAVAQRTRAGRGAAYIPRKAS